MNLEKNQDKTYFSNTIFFTFYKIYKNVMGECKFVELI